MLEIFNGIMAAANEVLAFFKAIGVDFVAVVIVMVIVTGIKMADKDRKAKALYVWLPFALALVVSLVFTPWASWREYVKAVFQSTLGVGAFASAFYNVYARTFKEKVVAKREAKKAAKGEA